VDFNNDCLRVYGVYLQEQTCSVSLQQVSVTACSMFPIHSMQEVRRVGNKAMETRDTTRTGTTSSSRAMAGSNRMGISGHQTSTSSLTSSSFRLSLYPGSPSSSINISSSRSSKAKGQ
jgi:hypothetical protein